MMNPALPLPRPEEAEIYGIMDVEGNRWEKGNDFLVEQKTRVIESISMCGARPYEGWFRVLLDDGMHVKFNPTVIAAVLFYPPNKRTEK